MSLVGDSVRSLCTILVELPPMSLIAEFTCFCLSLDMLDEISLVLLSPFELRRVYFNLSKLISLVLLSAVEVRGAGFDLPE